MFSKISNGLLGWINRTEIPSNHQPPSTSINDQLNVLSSENNAKVEADINGNCGGTKLEDRVITENLREEKKDVNEVMKLTQKEFVVVCDEKLEKDRAIKFPVMPEAKDCSSYLQTGFCFSGSNCKLNHPPNWKSQVEKVKEIAGSLDNAAQEVKKKNDSKAEKIDCKYFGSPGGSKSRKASNVNHNTKPYPTVQFNFMGLPIRQGVKDCSFYMSNGSCKRGVTCWFNHPDPMSVGEYDNQSGDSSQASILSSNASRSTSGSWSPLALSETPPYVPLMFPSTQGVTSLSEWNAYQAPVYQPERSMQQASAHSTNSQPLERNVAEFPERTGQPECNNFLKTGYCNMSACKFHHPNNEIAKSTSSAFGDSSLPPAVQPLIQEAVVSPSYDASSTQKSVDGSFVLNVHKSKAKQSMPVSKEQNANQNVRCEVCNINCASIQLYKKHTYGKKHANNLQKLQAEMQMSQTAQASQLTNAGKTRVVTDLETKENKLPRGRTAVPSLTGQAHVAKASLGPTLPSNPIPKSTEKITRKPVKGEDLVVLKEGKKHQKYVESSQNPKVVPTCLTSEKPTFKEPEDVETKIRKVLECGAPEDSVRTCAICNVVCNSETVLKSHLAGQKHAASVKQKQAEEEASITKNLTVDEPIDKICSSGETSIQSGKSMAGDTSMVTDLKEKDHKLLVGGTEVQFLKEKDHKLLEGGIEVQFLKEKDQKLLEGGIEVQSLKECAICHVLYTGEVEFAEHLTGKKHLAQVGALTTKSEPNPNSETIPRPDSTGKIYKNQNKIQGKHTRPQKDESLWCELCEIKCTRVEDLLIHKGGKKHKTKVEELQNPKTVDPARPEDSKPKIQKALSSGEAEAVKICTICYVMCKSETVFNAHMAGKRHANMVKKKQAAQETAIWSAIATDDQGSVTRLPVVEHPLA